MGKVDRLRNRIKPFAATFWALGIVFAITWPCPLAWHHSTTVHKSMFLYGHSWFKSQRRRVCPPFSYLGLLFIYAKFVIGYNWLICCCSGDRCEVDIDDCAPSPCNNNATCQARHHTTPHYLYLTKLYGTYSFAIAPSVKYSEIHQS